jgi:hypothetical protein
MQREAVAVVLLHLGSLNYRLIMISCTRII